MNNRGFGGLAIMGIIFCVQLTITAFVALSNKVLASVISKNDTKNEQKINLVAADHSEDPSDNLLQYRVAQK